MRGSIISALLLCHGGAVQALSLAGSRGRWLGAQRAPRSSMSPVTLHAWLGDDDSSDETKDGDAAVKAVVPPPPKGCVPGIGGTVLVSGCLKSSRDQFLFDLIHKQDVFDKVVAFSEDTKATKKLLISRSARYSGLLNVLDFAEGSDASLVLDPASETSPLHGVDAWVSFQVPKSDATQQAEAAKQAGVKHLVVVSEGVGAVDVKAIQAAVEGSDTVFTLLQCGSAEDGTEEGGPIELKAVDPDSAEAFAIPDGSSFPRKEAMRVCAESLLLPPAKNKAFALLPGGEGKAAEYLKELRGKGYSRTQELGFFMTGGYEEFAMKEEVEAERVRLEEYERSRPRTPAELEVIAAEKAAELAKDQLERDERDEEMVQVLIKSQLDMYYFNQRFATEEEAKAGFKKYGDPKVDEPRPLWKREGELPDHGINFKPWFIEANNASITEMVRRDKVYRTRAGLKPEYRILTDQDRKDEQNNIEWGLRRKQIAARDTLANSLFLEFFLITNATKLEEVLEEYKLEIDETEYIVVDRGLDNEDEEVYEFIVFDALFTEVVGQLNQENGDIEPYTGDFVFPDTVELLGELMVLEELAAPIRKEDKELEDRCVAAGIRLPSPGRKFSNLLP